MKRREFLTVTAKGGAFAVASPAILDLILRGNVSAGELAFRSSELGVVLPRVLEAALSGGGQFADVYLEEAVRTGITMADGIVQSVEYGVDKGGGVRVVSDWKTGYAFSDSWDEAALVDAAKVAREISRGGGSAVANLAESPSRGLVRYLTSPDEVDGTKKVELVTLIDKAARGYDPAIKQVSVTYRDELRRVVVATSDGVLVRQEIPLVWIEIDTLAERGAKRHPGYVRQSKRMGFEFADRAFVEECARDAARQAVDMLEAGDSPSGEMPVVIASGGGVVFHEAVGHGLEADAVERKASFYAGLAGTRVASDLVTIVDDGSIPNFRGSYDYDDEGTPSGKAVLIDGGILKGYMTDIITSRKLGMPATGNARRESYMHFPLVRMTNTYLDAGQSTPEAVIADTQRGIFAKRLGGGEVDTATGNFTFAVREAYLIEKGKVTTPVRGATLIGSGPEILKRIDMVANDLSFWPGSCGKGQWVPITSGSPTLRIASIVVGGSG
ncbi:MAG: TldD/PmbA family protein [bacterium]